jgi:hypothetical protein
MNLRASTGGPKAVGTNEPESADSVKVAVNIQIITEADQRSVKDVSIRRGTLEVTIPVIASAIQRDQGFPHGPTSTAEFSFIDLFTK